MGASYEPKTWLFGRARQPFHVAGLLSRRHDVLSDRGVNRDLRTPRRPGIDGHDHCRHRHAVPSPSVERIAILGLDTAVLHVHRGRGHAIFIRPTMGSGRELGGRLPPRAHSIVTAASLWGGTLL